MKILIFHQYYLMPGQGGGSRFNEMARFWTEAGHEVTVIAGSVDYTNGAKPEPYRGRWLLKEDDNRVTVWRCYVPETYGASYAGRMWAFFAFMFSAASGGPPRRAAGRDCRDVAASNYRFARDFCSTPAMAQSPMDLRGSRPLARERRDHRSPLPEFAA